MRKTNPSRDQLIKSTERRIKHLMIRVLEKFEDSFSDIDNTREGQIFKGDLRNAFNDVMRAQRDELHDYVVEYRPLRLTDDNVLAITQTFIQSVKKMEFDFIDDECPVFRLFASPDKRSVLDAIRAEFGAGVIHLMDEFLILEIVGLEVIINCVLPILDKHRLNVDVRDHYQKWRSQVVNIYRS